MQRFKTCLVQLRFFVVTFLHSLHYLLIKSFFLVCYNCKILSYHDIFIGLLCKQKIIYSDCLKISRIHRNMVTNINMKSRWRDWIIEANSIIYGNMYSREADLQLHAGVLRLKFVQNTRCLSLIVILWMELSRLRVLRVGFLHKGEEYPKDINSPNLKDIKSMLIYSSKEKV